MPQLEELETTYKAKIAAEIERYDKLIATRDVFSAQWDSANAAIIASHQEFLAHVLKEHEDRMGAEEVVCYTLVAVILWLAATVAAAAAAVVAILFAYFASMSVNLSVLVQRLCRLF